jgi:O-antigen/teichoic acid export membrane protein
LVEMEPKDRDELHFDTSHLKRDLGRRAAHGALWVVGSNGVRILIETARVIVLARLLQPADYGLVAMVTIVTGLIAMFQDLGLNIATVTREKITHAQVSTLFWVNVVVSAILMLAAAAIAPLLAWFYSEDRLVPITLALAPTFLLAGLTVQHQAILRRQMRFAALGTIRVSSIAIGVVTGIVMAYHGAAYWSLVGMTIASSTSNALAVWVVSRWRPGRPARSVGSLELIRFGTGVTGANLATYLSNRLDQVLLGWWWGAVPLGLYTKATSLVETPINRALTPVGSVVVPSLSRLLDEPARYRRAYLRILEKLALFSFPGAVFMVACAHWIVPFLLGPRWAGAAPMFGALAVLGLVRPIDASTLWLFITQNRAMEALRWSLLAGIISGGAAAIGLPWGGVGVAIALAASYLIRLPLLIWFVTRRGPLAAGDFYRALAAPFAASAVALLVLLGLAPHAADLEPAVVLAAGLAITAVVTLAILWVIPGGRDVLMDTWRSLRLFRKPRNA